MSTRPNPHRWPLRLWLVRHGESSGNIAHQLAHAAGDTHIEIATRDVDVPLSDAGVRQSRALGRWFAEQDEPTRPEVVLTSPYLRARRTADLIRECGGLVGHAAPAVADERLREREFGILDRLTRAGIEQLHPQQAEFRTKIGKFYHRPPGGESWCDVILRLRSALDTLSLHYATRRVLIVTHEVVVYCFRYLLEELDEAKIMAIDQQGDVVNCGVTEYSYEPKHGSLGGGLVLQRYNFSAPLERDGAPVTSARDQSTAAR
ncbi:MAG: histidine phosphatase family protein [Gammaproteobacteria bacterium]